MPVSSIEVAYVNRDSNICTQLVLAAMGTEITSGLIGMDECVAETLGGFGVPILQMTECTRVMWHA